MRIIDLGIPASERCNDFPDSNSNSPPQDTLRKANATMTALLADADLALKRSRRNARQDGNTLRDEISTLQKRRL